MKKAITLTNWDYNLVFFNLIIFLGYMAQGYRTNLENRALLFIVYICTTIKFLKDVDLNG